MYERTKVTISFLAERPLTESECAAAVRVAYQQVALSLGTEAPQQTYGPVTIEQTTVLSDE